MVQPYPCTQCRGDLMLSAAASALLLTGLLPKAWLLLLVELVTAALPLY